MKDTDKNYKAWEPCNIYPTAKIGKNTNVGAFCEIGKDVKIGKNCKIGSGAFIPQGVTIEDEVFIGPNVCFTNDKHPETMGHWVVIPTRVKKYASIGANATICPGITIGEFARVGAGSVVTKDVKKGDTVVGNPARRVLKLEDYYRIGD